MDDLDRKLEQLEERIRGTENALATLTTNISLSTNNLKENMATCHSTLGHRIDEIKDEMKDNQHTVTDSVDKLNASLQNLYVSHSGAQNTVKFNEKIIWGIVGLIFTVGLYLVQGFIKSGVAG